MRLTRAEIKLSNLKYNYLNIRKRVNNIAIMAVVKADAYGHGMLKVVHELEKLGQKKPLYYGVALLEEAIQLRKSKITKSKIVVFAPFKKDEIEDYLKFNIIPTITSKGEIVNLSRLKLRKKIKVHVNIDTGMGRVGIDFSDAEKLILKLSQLKNVTIDGVYTHFSTSDEKDKSFSVLQLSRFVKIISELKKLSVNLGVLHAANSGAILDLPDSYFDMVRAGISLYGYYPSNETSESIKLKPVMSLISEVSSVRQFPKETPVSYGRKFITRKDTKIISVPIGYADGVRRGLTNKMFGIIKDKKYPQVGTITMDRIMFDVGDTEVKVGDKIILIGKSGSNSITANDWCNILNTIPYEITCGISKRVPRVYK